jgi:Resolvase, N terminal domain
MKDARTRRFDLVVVARFDRFARSVSHRLRALEEFSHLGVDFVSLSESVDMSTPMGKMIFRVPGAVAELERNLIKERVHMGISRARKEGKQLGRPKRIFDREKARIMLRSMSPALPQKEGRPPPPTRRFPPPHRSYRLQFRGGLRSTWDLPNPAKKCQNKKLFCQILLGNAKTKSCFAKSYQEMPKQKVVSPNPTRKCQNKKLFCQILLGNAKTKSCFAKSY